MDRGDGRFEKFSAENQRKLLEEMHQLENKFPKHGGTFSVGQKLWINGSRFKVSKITTKKMVLRLMPKVEKD